MGLRAQRAARWWSTILVAAALVLTAAPQAAAISVQQVPAGATGSPRAAQVVTGPDGNVWFTELGWDQVGRITPTGALTEFPLESVLSARTDREPDGITVGPDGNLWVVERAQNTVAVVTPSGSVTTDSLGSGALFESHPHSIVSGPDGNLWITAPGVDSVVRMSPAGVVTQYGAGFTSGSAPTGIAVGPDGNLWVTEPGSDGVAQVSTSGVVSEFTTGFTAGAHPTEIAAGPDGNLWVTEPGIDAVARITTSGAVTEFSSGITPGAHPQGIAAGPDGNLWVTEPGIDAVARITTAGTVTEFSSGITPGAHPQGISAGPDGALWFTEPALGVGRIATDGTVTEYAAGAPQISGTTGIARGSDGNLWVTASPGNRIDRISEAGGVTSFSTGTSIGGSPLEIAAGPTGTLWFTEPLGNRVGEITTSGAVTEFSSGIGPDGNLRGITLGSDGNLWFEEGSRGVFGRITPSGVVTEFGVAPTRAPAAITLGPDGNVWATEAGGGGAIDQITPAGVITRFTAGLPPNSSPAGIAAGPDGNLWFTDQGADAIGQITPTGTITEFGGLSANAHPVGITAAPDGDLWFTEQGTDAIGRITTTGVVSESSAGIAPGTYPTDIVSTPDGLLWFTELGSNAIGQVDPQDPPVVTTGAASNITQTSATIAGTVNPMGGNAAVSVQWGTSTSYGHSASIGSVPAGFTSQGVSGPISGLPPASTIHYRVVATTPQGGTGYGADMTFTTVTPPPVTLTITISGDGAGYVTQSGAARCNHPVTNSGPTICSRTVAYGSTVVLGELANKGSSFGGWFGGCFVVAPTCTVTLTGNLAVTAFFHLGQQLTVNVSGSGAGTVKVGSVTGFTCAVTTPGQSNSCKATYPYGTTVSMTASPRLGATFAGWSGACTGTGSCSVTMFGAETVTATFTYDPGVHVNAIEITQGVQTPELPTRSATAPSLVRVAYSGVALPWSNGQPVTTYLAQDHATVVRVFVNTQLPRNGQPVPTMTLRAYRNGQLLDPGPIGPDATPPSSAVPVGALGSVTSTINFSTPQPQRYFGAYTFTLPYGWAEGDVDFVADTNPAPSSFPSCAIACQERGLILQGTHFNPVSSANVYPLPLTSNGQGPQGYTNLTSPPDPQWAIVQDVVPFPIFVHPYTSSQDVTTVINGCDGLTPANGQTPAQFSAAVYKARNATLLATVTTWASSSKNTSASNYPYGLAPGGAPTTCSAGGYSGGVTTGGRVLYASQPSSIASDDRPLTGIAHEFGHGVGLVHAGLECGSGSDPGADGASSNPTDQSDDIGQTGETFQPSFTNAAGLPVDGALDGVGLTGLDNPGSAYASRWNAVLPEIAPRTEIYDLMSYCTGGHDASAWISVRNWNRMVQFNAPGQVFARDAAAAAGPPPFRTNPPATAQATQSYSVIDVYDPASGRSLATAVAPDAGAPPRSTSGAMYTLTARDAVGGVLSSAPATATLVHVDHAPSQILIVGKVAAAGAREIDVLQSGHAIAVRKASPHKPRVVLVAPAAGAVVGGRGGVTVRWRSHDADGGALTVTVRYSADAGRTWQTVYSGPDHGSARLPGFLLARSANARLRVYVSDGFNEAIATSRRFTSRGLPPTVAIVVSRAHIRLAAGAPLDLTGSAFDDSGVRLTGRALSWRSGRQLLGRGERLSTVALGAGRHTITLSARDRYGRTSSAAVVVTVIASPPVITALRVARRVSPRARSLTLRIAALAPDTISIAGSRFLIRPPRNARIGRVARTFRVQIKPGRGPLSLVLTLRSGSYRMQVLVTVKR